MVNTTAVGRRLHAPRPRAASSSLTAVVVAIATTVLVLAAGPATADAYSPTAPPPSSFVDNIRRQRPRGAARTTTTARVGHRHSSFVPHPPPGELTRFDYPVSDGEKGEVHTSQTVLRGGASSSSSSSEPANSGNAFLRSVSSFWACFGVVGILAKSIGRIVPIALEPFSSSAPSPLTNFQLGAYVLTCVWFAYVEGYKGFQLKFSPLVVSRSRTLYSGDKRRHTPFHHVLLGPFYAMGLFHATKKRVITSWSVTLGVAAIVGLVKRMPYPWRNVVDAGVVVGLTWGTISIVVGYVRALVTGDDYPIDPALPEEK